MDSLHDGDKIAEYLWRYNFYFISVIAHQDDSVALKSMILLLNLILNNNISFHSENESVFMISVFLSLLMHMIKNFIYKNQVKNKIAEQLLSNITKLCTKRPKEIWTHPNERNTKVLMSE